MKSFLKSTVVFIAFAIVLFGCSGESKIGCIDEEPDAKTIKDIRNLKDFTGVKLLNNSSVNIIRDDNFSVSVTGKPYSVQRLTTTVVEGDLVIDFSENCEFNTSTIVTVHLPVINKISLLGSGGINVQGGFRDSDLDSEILGSGDIRVGPLSHFKTSKIKIKGSGNYDAFRSICDDGNVDILGSGKAKISPLKSLFVDITGSGNVIYSGDSTLQVKYSLTGTGRLKKYSK